MKFSKGEALIELLDDPDETVFEAVSQKIHEVGSAMLPDLESAAKKTMSPLLHERIELIIKTLQFDSLKNDLSEWIKSPFPRLLDGAWLMVHYQFPDFSKDQLSLLIKPLRDEIWLEISDTLTSIEKIRVMSRLFFVHDRIELNESHPDSPGNNYINRVLETGKCNEHSINLLYALLAQELGMPVYVVEMSEYPILAYMDTPVEVEEMTDPGLFDVLFYINPTDNGTLHSRDDITNFLIRDSRPLDPIFYEPKPNTEFIRICLEKLALDYKSAGSEKRQMQVQDLLNLWKY